MARAGSYRPRPRSPGCSWCDLPVHGDNRGWFKENWQREKMVGPRPARLRAGAEQHLVQRQGRHHPRHPRRAVGQVRLRRHGPDLRRLGGPARGADLRRRLHRRDRAGAGDLRSARVGNAYQTLEDNTAYTYLVNDHWSPDAAITRSSTSADETAGDRLADPAGRGRALGQGPRPPAPGDVVPMPPARPCPRARTASSGKRCARLLPDAESADRGRARPRRPRRRWTASTGATTARSSTPRPTPPWMRPRRPRGAATAWAVNVDARRRLACLAREHGSRWCTSPPTTCSTAPRGPLRGRAVLAAGRLRADQGGR